MSSELDSKVTADWRERSAMNTSRMGKFSRIVGQRSHEGAVQRNASRASKYHLHRNTRPPDMSSAPGTLKTQRAIVKLTIHMIFGVVRRWEYFYESLESLYSVKPCYRVGGYAVCSTENLSGKRLAVPGLRFKSAGAWRKEREG